MSEYAVAGATLSCTMGAAEGKLMVIPHGVQVGGKDKANIGDCKPFVNVMPFGTCKIMSPPIPCVPACVMWLGGKTNVLVQGLPALMKGDKTICPVGAGMIEVKDSGQ